MFTIPGGVGAELNVSIFWPTYLTLDVLNPSYLPWFFAEQARVHETMLNTYLLLSISQVLLWVALNLLLWIALTATEARVMSETCG